MIKYSSTKEDAQGSETMSPECDTQCPGLTASSLLSPWLRVLPVLDEDGYQYQDLTEYHCFVAYILMS